MIKRILSFWDRISIYGYRAAMRFAFRKPSPNIIPMSGSRMAERDYYSVYLGGKENPWRFLIQRIGIRGAEGLWFEGPGVEGVHLSIPYSSVIYYNVSIKHYFRELELTYSGWFCFLIKQVFRSQYFLLWRERIIQKFYNKSKMIRRDRIEILKIITEKTIKNYKFQTSSFDIATSLYGVRWIHHPDNNSLHQYHTILLDSLVETGDLIKENISYRLLPKALSTLSNFEEDNRKHRSMVYLQMIIIVLTIALVAVGLLQAWVTYSGSSGKIGG